MERGAASTKIQSVLPRSPAPRDTSVDDGAAPRGDAGRVGESVVFLEVDGVAVSWYYDFCRERSPGVAEHYIARGRHAALAAVVMLGLALHSARVVLHGDWLRGPNEVVGYICLLLRLVLMRLRLCSCRCVFARS